MNAIATAMENILTNEDKQNASAKITVTNIEHKNKLMKTGIGLRSKRHRVDRFVNISPDAL